MSAANPAETPSGTATVVIDHPEGQIEVPASAVIRLTEPLLGFPDRLEYALIPAAREGIWWFISVHQPTVTFVLADPFVVKPDYGVDLTDADQAALQISSVDDGLALVMLSLPPIAGERVTANFRAPLVFNLQARYGMQIMGRDEMAELRATVSLSSYPTIFSDEASA